MTDAAYLDSDSTAYDRCEQALESAFANPNPVLVDALPAMGKSSGAVRWAEQNDEPITVFTARHDLYDQYEEWADEEGLSIKVLPSFHNDCPSMDDDGELKEEIQTLYGAGLGGKRIHNNSRQLLDRNLPCQQDGACSYMEDRDFDPEQYDILVGHYLNAHASRYIEERYVVFDELPEDTFLDSFDANEVSRAVTHFLESNEDFPFETSADLNEYRRNPERKAEGMEWFEARSQEIRADSSAVYDDRHGDAHSMAPIMTYAILSGEDPQDGLERAELPDGSVSVRDRGTKELTILRPPDLGAATSVIALDGTPSVEKWRLMLGSDLEHQRVLTDDQRKRYIEDELGLSIIQTTDELKPYASGEYVTPPKDQLLFEGIAEREGQSPSLISSQSAIDQYEEEGALDCIDQTEYYRNFIGTNEFKHERLGIVAGSFEWGTDSIKLWGALADRAIESNGEKGMDRSYGGFGDKILHGMRENQVLQAIMRFGREEKDGQRGALIYVNTAALPDWVPTTQLSVDIHLWRSEKDGMAQVITAIGDQEEGTTSEIADHSAIEVSHKQTRRNLKTLCEYGYVGGENQGPGVGYLWRDICSNEASPSGHIEFRD